MAVKVGAADASVQIPTLAAINLDTTGVGMWSAGFIRMPATFGFNLEYIVLPLDPGRTGSATAANTHNIFVRGQGMSPNPARVANRGRSSASAEIWDATERTFAAMPAIPGATNCLVIVGVRKVSGAWTLFRAYCPVGGSATVGVGAVAPPAGWITSAVPLINQVFSSAAAGAKTPVDTAVDHVVNVRGDFPFSGGVPDAAIVEALAANAATLRYDSPSVLAGGAILDYRTLTDAADLSDKGPGSRAAAVVVGSIATAPAVASWMASDAITITERPARWVFGGRGTRTQAFSGTYAGAAPVGFEIKVSSLDTGLAIPGWDWGAKAPVSVVIAGGNWSLKLAGTGLPIGSRYKFEIRETGAPSRNAATANSFDVGVRIAGLGQSQYQRMGIHNKTMAPIAGMRAAVMDVINRNAGGGGAYAQPVVDYQPLTAASATGSGYMAMANRWWELTGVPLMIINTPTEGTSVREWDTNGPYGQWTHVGDGVTVPGPVSAGTSGIQTLFAITLERDIDAWMLNWGTSDLPYAATMVTTLTAVLEKATTGLDAIYSNCPAPPILVVPFPRQSSTASIPNIMTMRDTQRAAGKAGGRFKFVGEFHDWVMDNDGGPHPAAMGGAPVLEVNWNGSGRGGFSMGQYLAGYFDPAIKRFGPLLLKAVFTDATRNVIEIETGRALRTIGGAALKSEIFFVSTDSGATFVNAGFTAAIVGTKIRLTKSAGSWPASDVTVDAIRSLPMNTDGGANGGEIAADAWMDGLPFDDQTYRGKGYGQHLTGVGGTGIPVAAKAGLGPRLVATIKLPPGIYNVPVRMAHGGGNVDKVLSITVTA